MNKLLTITRCKQTRKINLKKKLFFGVAFSSHFSFLFIQKNVKKKNIKFL